MGIRGSKQWWRLSFRWRDKVNAPALAVPLWQKDEGAGADAFIPWLCGLYRERIFDWAVEIDKFQFI